MIAPYYQDDDHDITIYHGDSRLLIPALGLRGDLLLSDPPYGIDHDTDYTRFSGGQSSSRNFHAPIAGDDEAFDPTPLLGLAPRIVLFGANCFSDKLPLGSWLIWDKRAPGTAKGVLSDGETAWYNQGHGVYIFSHTWSGFLRASERGTAHHPTQKPVALMRWVLERCSKPGDVVLDPYMGSGPIAQAAKELGRGYIGIEIEERYCATGVDRLRQASLLAPTPVRAEAARLFE